MNEEDLKVFVRGTESFFDTTTSMPVSVSTPYIMKAEDHVVYDFSAVIGVSGSQRGVVFYSAPRTMLSELVECIGETSFDDAILADYVGEIANTLSGNARQYFNTGFMISVPVVFSSPAATAKTHFPQETPAFVIPLEWRGHQSSLIICLEEGDSSSELDRVDAALDEVEDDGGGDDDC